MSCYALRSPPRSESLPARWSLLGTGRADGLRLAWTLFVAVEIFPRITGVKVENLLARRSEGLVRCTVRLTRRLTSRETDGLRVLLGVESEGFLVHYACRPEEVEEREESLLRALAQLTRWRDHGATRRARRPLAFAFPPTARPSRQ